MLVKKYLSEVVSIYNRIEGVYTIDIIPLTGRYKYAPGQFLHLSLDADYDGTGQWPESRCFSMQSNQDNEFIRITYSAKGRYTRLMEANLKVGSKVWVKLPFGDLFTKPHSIENTVFIAGGTGITPFLSLFATKLFDKYINPSIYLGFKSPIHNIYSEEIGRISNSSVNCKYFYHDVDGNIDINQIYSKHGNDSFYFISGPPAMIIDFRTRLMSNSLKSDHILTDDWQ